MAIVRSGLISLAGTALRASVQIASNVVVARLLGPDAYGTAATVLALGIVLELVRNSGFAAVVLRSGDQPNAVMVALHRASTLVGVLLAAVVGCAGLTVLLVVPWAPYGTLLLVVATAFPLAGFVAVPIAGMARRHEMARVVAIESISVVLGAVLSIVLASSGAGPIAMVAQVVVLWVAVAVGVIVVRNVPRGPAAPWAGVRSMAGLARDVSLVQLVSLVARAGDRVLAAVLFGPAAAGLYVQAMQLMTLPLDQIGAAVQRIAVPALAAAEVDPRRRYRQLVRMVTLLAWPVLTLLGVLAEPVVRLLFGAAWIGSAGLLPFLAVAGGAQAAGFSAVWYFVASGRSGRQLRWALVTQPVVIAGIAVGAQWGLRGMAAGYAATCVILVVPAFLVSTWGTSLRLRDLAVSVVPAATASGVAALAAVAARDVVSSDPAGGVLLPAVLGVAAAGLVSVAFPTVRGVLHRPLLRGLPSATGRGR
ncbi:oligosaccharide flippase family protein [Curtobacterium sp. MCJR17_020]|uniref:oligosaccharide flippase family protein n=1 Tax=Curtobacterium sp. MCJR17_020 TaxID=2175619 RepID=UPI000DA83611|nr:oligosaccharide flippase family protein [Curtobacterium sp. MCJR17_020]WIE71065.1 oligosaccharide flippase family protein [Curtobacterium sp. MCJR17_020]